MMRSPRTSPRLAGGAWLACGLLLAAAVPAIAGAAKTPAAVPAWELDSDSHGIRVWTRMLPGAPLKDFRGVMEVDAPLAVVVAAVTDVPAYTEWFFQMREARLVEGKSLDEAYVYFALAGLWPVSDRDAVIKASVAQDPESLVVSMAADGVAEKIPAVKGRVRMPILHSGWKLTPLSPNRTEIELIGNADPGGWIPLWISNSVVQLMPRETLKRLRIQLANTKYSDPEKIFAGDSLLRELRTRIRFPDDPRPGAAAGRAPSASTQD